MDSFEIASNWVGYALAGLKQSIRACADSFKVAYMSRPLVPPVDRPAPAVAPEPVIVWKLYVEVDMSDPAARILHVM